MWRPEFVAVCHNSTENTTVVLELNQRQFSIHICAKIFNVIFTWKAKKGRGRD